MILNFLFNFLKNILDSIGTVQVAD